MAVLDRLSFGKKRCAFVLANEKYGKYGPLANASRDVDAIAQKFRDLGFEVDLHKNLGPGEIGPAFDKFTDKIERYGTIDTAVIYYAGHGFQEGGRNYILTVPDMDGEVSDFPVTIMIDPLKDRSERRLLFFDACRSYLDVDAAQKSMAKHRSVHDAQLLLKIRSGLTDAQADYGSEVVLSFSASPGQPALDEARGGSEMSPYATSLIRHIDSVDLSLSNILGRVQEDVRRATADENGEGGQGTWAAVTLSRPYFFNPSSLLFLSGNLMSFIAFFTGLAITLLAFLSFGAAMATQDAEINFGLLMGPMLIMGLAFAALIYGMARAYNRARGTRTDDNPLEMAATANPTHGTLGGLLGGIISTPLVAVPFWWNWRISTDDERIRDANCPGTGWLDPLASKFCPRLPNLLVEIAIAGVVVSAVLGLLAIIYSNRLRHRKSGWTVVLGGHGRLCLGAAYGGTIAGLIVGPPVTAYFGSLDRPFFHPDFIMAPAILSVAVIAYSIVNYSLDRFTGDRLKRSFIAAGFATIITALPLALLLYGLSIFDLVDGILEWARRGFWNETRSLPVRYSYLLVAGVPYGVIFGAFLGLLIGITRALTEPWDGLRNWFDRSQEL